MVDTSSCKSCTALAVAECKHKLKSNYSEQIQLTNPSMHPIAIHKTYTYIYISYNYMYRQRQYMQKRTLCVTGCNNFLHVALNWSKLGVTQFEVVPSRTIKAMGAQFRSCNVLFNWDSQTFSVNTTWPSLTILLHKFGPTISEICAYWWQT